MGDVSNTLGDSLIDTVCVPDQFDTFFKKIGWKMRQSLPKNDGLGRGVGGPSVKSFFAHFDNLKSLLGSLHALWY